MLHIGVDLGTSTIKISCGDVSMQIPSLIGEPNPGWSGGTLDTALITNLVVIEGRDEWYIG